MTVTFQTERFLDCIAEIEPLLRAHWEEIARNRDTIPLNIDRIAYSRMDEWGQLLIVTARASGQIIGYLVHFIMPNHLHYVGTKWAESDVYYVDPEFRSIGIGPELFRFAEAELRKCGVKVIHTRAKNEHPAAGKLLDHLGHMAIETIYEKVLK